MQTRIIDRRAQGSGKSTDNRQRFMRRHRAAMQEAVRKRIQEGKIGDVVSRDEKEVRVRTGKTDEPVFQHGPGGQREFVAPGNKEFVARDTIPRPPAGSGAGKKGAPDGEGEDDFQFVLTTEEYQDIFFDGLELPNLVKRALRGEEEFWLKRAGFAREGPHSQLDLVRTLRFSKARRWALHRLRFQRQKRELEEERENLERELAGATGADIERIRERLVQLQDELDVVQRKLDAIPFLDPLDARYRRHERVPIPVHQAVMFCLMDVSGSMGEWEKEMAKRFFVLLYWFLKCSYEHVEVVFIRHHHTAKEVDEETFFRSRESGGTVVSTSLALMVEIVAERFPVSSWNIYGAQASDGENWDGDSALCGKLMREAILELVQYFAYVQIEKEDTEAELWDAYQSIASTCPHFDMARINDAKDIYPVFRGLFEPKSQEAT